MILRRYLLILYKVAFALLGLTAIITEITTLMQRGRFMPANFFSFFTIESNLFAVAVLLMSALGVAVWQDGRRMALVRGAATLYMITTGLVFAVLLSGLDVELTAVPWDNVVLHYIMPVVLALDWIMHPPRVRMSFAPGLVWLIFPLIYVSYSLIRGALVGWYPYPFLNPAEHGYGGVALTSLGIAALELALIWILTRFGVKQSR